MNAKQITQPTCAVVCGMLLLSCGCLTPRQEARLDRFPHNRVFLPDSAPKLPEGQAHRFYEFDAGEGQSICLLQLAPDAARQKRYHAYHDMTLFVVAGTAVVQVEGTRYFVTPGSAVLLPRLTAYAILPHRAEEPFQALLVYSPPFDGTDTVLEK